MTDHLKEARAKANWLNEAMQGRGVHYAADAILDLANAIEELQPKADSRSGEEWFITHPNFFCNGGRALSGPYSSQDDAMTARRIVERLDPKGLSYYIDSAPAGSVEPA